MSEELEVNGEWLKLDNCVLEEFICVESWPKESLSGEVNSIYLKVDGIWHRLYFDCCIVFWRKNVDVPKEYDMHELDMSFKLVDLGKEYSLVGKAIKTMRRSGTENKSNVTIELADNKTIQFSCEGDAAKYKIF